MLKAILISSALAMAICATASVASAQNVGGRAEDLVAQLDKTKHKVKDKRGTHVESFMEIRNEAATVRPADLTGHYVSPDASDIYMDLKVSSEGTAAASGIGFENEGVNSVRVSYTFKGHIEGSLLTGTRTMENGRSAPFEAVFVNRTTREGTTQSDAKVTYHGFGLGYIQQDDTWTNRIFLEKK